MTETDYMKRVWLKLQGMGYKLFRNNVGGGKLQLPNGQSQWIDYGLAPGSSDLIGWKALTVTKEMVGQKIAVFVALECKSETGRLTNAQKNFLETVLNDGGFAGVSKCEHLDMQGPTAL